jgi:hypothetical protein
VLDFVSCRSGTDGVKSGGAADAADADWLEKLGMSEYAQRFAENDIDVEVLSELTDKDFDRLGVSIGHRRKIIRAIREFARSANRTVTVRRSASPSGTEGAGATRRDRSPGGEGGAATGTVARGSWIGSGVAASFCPHFGQNAKSAAQAKPQPMQRKGWRAPHFGQNENSA